MNQSMNPSDLAAIEFFNEMQYHVSHVGLVNLDREDRILFRKGKKLIEGAIKVAKSTSKNVGWLPEEYDYIAQAYFKYGRNQADCLKYFRQFSDRHTDKSVKIALYSCPALDTEVKDITGLKDFAQGLLDALNNIQPGRFKSTR